MPRRPLEAVPLLEPKQQEPSEYPLLQYGLAADGSGVVLIKITDPTETHSQLIPAAMMDDMVKAWREFRHQQASQLQTIAAVRRTRND